MDVDKKQVDLESRRFTRSDCESKKLKSIDEYSKIETSTWPPKDTWQPQKKQASKVKSIDWHTSLNLISHLPFTGSGSRNSTFTLRPVCDTSLHGTFQKQRFLYFFTFAHTHTLSLLAIQIIHSTFLAHPMAFFVIHWISKCAHQIYFIHEIVLNRVY